VAAEREVEALRVIALRATALRVMVRRCLLAARRLTAPRVLVGAAALKEAVLQALELSAAVRDAQVVWTRASVGLCWRRLRVAFRSFAPGAAVRSCRLPFWGGV
jgi:predicted acyltransferase